VRFRPVPLLRLSLLRQPLRTIVQEPTTKRCGIVEERPTSPSVGVVIGPAGFGVRTEAESRMRTVEECHESGTTGGTTVIEERERRPAR
jgi:hypothetical protein